MTFQAAACGSPITRITMKEPDYHMVDLISKGVDRAKLGEAVRVYEEITAGGNAIPERSHYAMGWIIYYALHQLGEREVGRRKHLLRHYLALRTPRPHKLHSMILCEALRLRENVARQKEQLRTAAEAPETFSLMRFLQLWDTANLRPGDWLRHEYEGRRLSSTVEKLITLYVGEATKGTDAPSGQFTALIDRALSEYPDSHALLGQRASLHAMTGDREAARRLLRTALVMAPGKFHLWSRLASLIDTESEPRLKMALLVRAMQTPGQQDFKGRVRLDMARIWITRELFGEAVWELAEVRRLYEGKGWHLPRAYAEMTGKIPAGTAAKDPSAVYSRLSPLAEAEIYSSIPAITARKTYHKRAQPASPSPAGWKKATETAWRVTDGQGRNYWFQPSRYGIDPELPLGTPLSIRLHNDKIVHASTAAQHSQI